MGRLPVGEAVPGSALRIGVEVKRDVGVLVVDWRVIAEVPIGEVAAEDVIGMGRQGGSVLRRSVIKGETEMDVGRGVGKRALRRL